jgi:hypothetical protein
MKIFKLFFNHKGDIKKTQLVAVSKKEIASKRFEAVSEYGQVCMLAIKTNDGLNMARVNAKNEREAREFLKDALLD